MRFLTVAEVRRLAVAIGPAYRALILLGAYGGLRIGEMAGLRRKRLDLAAGVVEVAEVVTEMHGHLYLGPPKTTAGRRRVGLPRVVVEALLAVGVDADPVALQAVGAGAVALVDGDADPGELEALGQAQAAGPGTDDDDVDRRGGHGLTLPVVVSARVGRLGRSWCCIGRCPSTITPQRGGVIGASAQVRSRRASILGYLLAGTWGARGGGRGRPGRCRRRGTDVAVRPTS
jgi:hypothetical protein